MIISSTWVSIPPLSCGQVPFQYAETSARPAGPSSTVWSLSQQAELAPGAASGPLSAVPPLLRTAYVCQTSCPIGYQKALIIGATVPQPPAPSSPEYWSHQNHDHP